MSEFILGACAMACVVAGHIFFQYWRRTQDRLFAIFALAFLIMAINRVAVAFLAQANEIRTHLYVVRLAAFGLILFAIIDKNRKPAASNKAGT